MSDWATGKLRDRLRKLHALIGSANRNEREAAYAKIDEILTKHKKTWNDLNDLLWGGSADNKPDDPDDDANQQNVPRVPPPLDLIRHILERHLYLSEHQLVAVTLWIAHSFLFNQFSVTPRLVLVSPVRGCGKSTLLSIINNLGCKTRKSDHTTPAVLFRLMDRERPTLLLDEADNQDLLTNSTLRAVLNSGHRHDGRIMRHLDGHLAEFSTFAPVALATIGRLPLPLMHRSVVIHMGRSPNPLTRFDPKTIPSQQADLDIIYREVLMWAPRVILNLDPRLPEQLNNRPADNWRPLVAIADACSQAWGKAAREAAIALSKNQDEDFGVILLQDIRTIFDLRPTADRLASAVLVNELNDLPDAAWSEWRGPKGDQHPRKITQRQLAIMLAAFGIKPRTIWPLHRHLTSKSARGYFRNQFEAAWAAYCEEGNTPTQSSKNNKLLAS
jgi:hypothetical protein